MIQKIVLLIFIFYVSKNISAQNFEKLSASDMLYSLEFPAHYENRMDTIELNTGVHIVYHFFSHHEETGITYSLSDTHYPYKISSHDSIFVTLLEDAIYGIEDQLGGQIIYKDIQFNKDAFVLNGRIKTAKGLFIRIRIFTADDRMIILQVHGDKQKILSSPSNHFFNGLYFH